MVIIVFALSLAVNSISIVMRGLHECALISCKIYYPSLSPQNLEGVLIIN